MMLTAGSVHIAHDWRVLVQLAIEVKGQPKLFKFDRVFGAGATQADVYEDTRPLVRSVLDGKLPFTACESFHRLFLLMK